ncbi:hypothetical protein [Thalassospira lohafexi]|uniref:Uncharacterized protein n=1 Tax=Thalassospira lohafexi TaxID=744227 RepID=A0A2N3L3W6_9PROT|nr:hypothetical protein [Thalassospira lohafexi]PKR57514.1 hypothetical protein COO92_16365 [Thalassospira lohafexi]
MKRIFGIACVAVLFLWPSVPISAGPVCGDRAKVIASLSDKYAEAPVAVGVTANGGVIEVLTSPNGESWTILFSYPAGPSFLVASGEAWQDIKPVLTGPGT